MPTNFGFVSVSRTFVDLYLIKELFSNLKINNGFLED